MKTIAPIPLKQLVLLLHVWNYTMGYDVLLRRWDWRSVLCYGHFGLDIACLLLIILTITTSSFFLPRTTKYLVIYWIHLFGPFIYWSISKQLHFRDITVCFGVSNSASLCTFPMQFSWRLLISVVGSFLDHWYTISFLREFKAILLLRVNRFQIIIKQMLVACDHGVEWDLGATRPSLL